MWTNRSFCHLMNFGVPLISNNIRFSLNLKNYSIQTGKPWLRWHPSLTMCDVSLRRPNPNPISIWQLLSLWVKSLISIACQGKIYNGPSSWIMLVGCLSWLDAAEEQSLPSWQTGLFVSTEPWEAILFQPHPISSQFEWRRLVLQSAASATRIKAIYTLAHENQTVGGAALSKNTYLPVSTTHR